MKIQSTIQSRPGLLFLGFGMLSAPLQQALAVDGTWIGNVSNVAPNGIYTNSANWVGGIVASGTDSTASFIYNPVSDAGGTGIAGNFIFNADQTLGNIVLDDTDGFGSATVSWAQATAGTPLNLTLDTTTGTPTLTTGQLLNSISGGKKVVINHNILGTDGLTTNGPGFISFRGSPTASSISGTMTVAGGAVQQQSVFGSITALTVNNGGTLVLDYNTAQNSPARFAAVPLTLGGAGGSGVITNINWTPASLAAAQTTAASQTFGGVTLNAGTHQIIANTATPTISTFVLTQNMTYTLGTVTNNGKAALNLARPTAAGTGIISISNPNTPQGITGGWATFGGNNFATNSSGVAAAYSTYVTDTWAAGNNTTINKSASLTSASTFSLRYDSGAATTLQLTGTNTIASGGLISAQQSPLITGGKITSGTADFITHVNAGTLRIASDISDNGGGAVTLVKALGGTLQLESDMSYTGGTVLGAGTITLGRGFSGGPAGSPGSGAVILSANNTTTGAYAPSGTLAFNRSGTYTVTNAINPVVNSGGYLAQVANGGTLILNQAAKVGGFIQQSGTTRLDFDGATSPLTQIIDGVFTTGPTTIHTARLTGRNGTLELLGKAGSANVQSFALTDVAGSVNVNLSPGSGGTMALNLGVLNRLVNDNNGGGTLAFTLPAGASATTTFGTASSLISDSGVAFVTLSGNEWGAKNAANTQIVAGSTISGFYTATAGTGITAATNTDVTVSDTVTGTIQTNSLRFNTAAATTVTVNTAGTLRPGGILVSSAVGPNVTTISGPGDLRANTGNRDLPIFQNNGRANLTIGAPIVNFDATNVTHLVKNGAGEVELTSAGNTYTGRTFLNEGILRLSGSAAIGSATTRTGSVFGRSGELIIQDSAKVFTGTFSSFGQRQGESSILTVKNSGIFDISADFNIGDVNAKSVLNISDSALVTVKSLFVGKGGYSEGLVNQTGGTLIAGNTPTQEWNLGGNGAADTAATGTYNLSGGTLNLLAQSFNSGRWGTGTLNISGAGAVTGNGWNVIGRFHTGVGTVNISGGTYNANAGGTGQTFMIVGEEGTGTLAVSGTGIVTAKSLSLAHNGGNGTVNQTGGTVDLQATTANAGVLFGQTNAPGRLVPDYRGTYNLSGGVLKTFGIRENPTITTPVASTINFNGGTVQAIANNATFMDNLDLAAVQSGGALFDTSSFSIEVAQKLVHDTALGAIPDGGLNKTGIGGTLALSGINTYTGPTSVTSGTLLVNGDHTAAAGNITVASGATLGGSGILGGALTVNGGFTPGTSPNTLTTTSSASFATGSTLTYELNGGDQTIGGGINDLFTGVTALILNGTLNIVETVPLSFSLVTSGSWRLINYSGALSGGGLTLGTQPTLPSGYSFAVNTSTPGQINLSVVPEPAVTGLLGGLLALVGFRRRRAAPRDSR